MLPIIGISYGDAAGVGPELIARLIAKHAFTGCCRPLLIGDARVFCQGMEIIGQQMPLHVIRRAEEAVYGDAPDVLDIRSLSPEDYTLGKEQTCCGEDAYQSMKHALDLLKAKKIAGFLYAPQNKTSFVAERSGQGVYSSGDKSHPTQRRLRRSGYGENSEDHSLR